MDRKAAGKYKVPPIDSRLTQPFADERPQFTRDRISHLLALQEPFRIHEYDP
jgi:hypothetical protein